MKLKVLIQPSSKKNEIVGLLGDSLKIKIKAPPVDGKANAEVVSFLSEALDLPKKNIRVIHGEISKIKLIEIETNLQLKDILKRLLPKT